MPLIHSIQIGEAKTGIWRLEEPEGYFTERIEAPASIRHPHKRLQHLAARYLLTELCSGFPVHRILTTASGKPYLPGEAYHFSLSHSGDYAAAIVSRHKRVGVDIEAISGKVERVAHRFLDAEEIAFMDEAQRRTHLTVCWCAKEAVYKWHGEGGVDFSRDIRLEKFLLLPAGMIRAAFHRNGHAERLTLYYQVYDRYCLVWVQGE